MVTLDRNLCQKDSLFYILKIVIISKTIGVGNLPCTLGSFHGVPFSECEKRCDDDETCLAFNYDDQPLGCYMKKEWKEDCPLRSDNGRDAYLKYDMGKVSGF